MRFDGVMILAAALFCVLLLFTAALLHQGAGMGTRKVARLGTLLSLALILGLVEGFLPDFLLPGMRLGLANIALLLILYVYGFKDGLYVAVLKAILVSMLRGSFLSMGGWMALTGTLLSYLAMSALHYAWKGCSIYGVSILGALCHVAGQILIAYLYLGVGVWGYLPWLLLFAFFSGAATAFLCSMLLKNKALLRYLKQG